MAPSSIQDLFDVDNLTSKSITKPAPTHQPTAPDCELFRHLVPLVLSGKTVHLNAAFMPPSNLIALNHPSPKAHWKEDIEAVRVLLGRYINTELEASDEASQAFGGDNVVTLNCEHPNQAFPWLTLRSTGLEVRLVPTDTENPVAADAATFVPFRNNVAGVCAAFRHKGIHVLADLTQQVGFTAVDVKALGVSAAAFSLHKGLNSPTGFAALYVDTNVIKKIDPIPSIIGYGGVSSVGDSEDFTVPEGPVIFHPTAKQYEHANMSLISAVAAGTFLQFDLDVMEPKTLEDRLYSLGDTLRQSCADLGVSVVGPSERRHHAPHLHVLHLQDRRWIDRLEAAGI
ncbi:pyridoxal phosphate-dependent transferase [Colletotrichum godetiae]|uniref:Pyridoxal phosphate-dependent transferase n=1 Tax=Colletotrichum godetiae TaxID=1209918 RepID=A0AAJ0AKA3_9PEZI|nr:pyridoxal phosphate-dependent transferase [Colletotrichum godetiae]KAK1675432.1 pyridoxal phosphate-dependent transferase [Colletotrichum godetiae]